MSNSSNIAAAVLLLAFAEGCGGALAQPFEGAKSAPMIVYRLQNYEPPQVAGATPGAPALPFVLPPEIQQYWAPLAGKFAGLLPPGLAPGATGLVGETPDPSVPRFHDFRILAYIPVQDQKQHDELMDIFGHDSNFAVPRETCMYADFGVTIAPPGQAPIDILISPPCGQVKTVGFVWPYGNSNGLTPDSNYRILSAMNEAFGGH